MKIKEVSPGFCPMCGMELHFAGTDHHVISEGIGYNCHCPACEFTGTEEYNLTFCGFLGYDKDGNRRLFQEGELLKPEVHKT